MKRAASVFDFLVCTGGVSGSDADHVVASLLATGGSCTKASLALKPGKPLAIGRIGRMAVLALPGNPVAVIPDARGLSEAQMQAIANEFNLAETTFVLPPADPAHTARVRIFTPRAEMHTIMQGIKGATARYANQILGRGGKSFWQQEYYDRFCRNDKEFQNIRGYIAKNPVKAGLVARPEDWKWSSLPGWRRGDPLLWRGEAPVRDERWLERVNEPLSVGDLQRLRHSVQRGRPYGGEAWTRETAIRLGLESCLRPPGRPLKEKP